MPPITSTSTSTCSSRQPDAAPTTESTRLISKSDDSNGSDSLEKSSKKEQRQWVLSTASLGCAMLIQSYLLVGVFPYSGFLAMHLIPGLTEETAGSYAGLIASSFMVGRTFSSFHWGRAADRYGRTFVIKASLALSAIFSVLFGLAPTFPLALLARCMLGLCNGLVLSIKTLITELSHGDQAKETNMMAIVMGMWGYGFLINPAITGYLSDPVKQFPDSELVELMGPVLRAYPFLLPNLVGCLFCLLGLVLVHFNVEETLPLDRRHSFGTEVHGTTSAATASIIRNVSSWGLFKNLHSDGEVATGELDEENDSGGPGGGKETTNGGTVLPRWVRPSPSTTALVILSQRSSKERSGENNDGTAADEKQTLSGGDHDQPAPAPAPVTIRSLWSRKPTRQHLAVYWFYSFLVISIDETLPLYCISKASGLAIEERMIGNIFSGTGLVYIAIQYLLLTKLVDRFGFYKSLRIGTMFSIPLVCLIPISLITNRGAPEGTLTWSTLSFLSVTYAIPRAFSAVVFSTLTMTTNRTVPANERATMNGLSMLGGSLAKGIGPIFAGTLFSFCAGHITPPFGSLVVYGIIASLGLCLFVQALMLPEHDSLLDNKNVGTEKPQNNARGDEKKGDEEDSPPTF